MPPTAPVAEVKLEGTVRERWFCAIFWLICSLGWKVPLPLLGEIFWSTVILCTSLAWRSALGASDRVFWGWDVERCSLSREWLLSDEDRSLLVFVKDFFCIKLLVFELWFCFCAPSWVWRGGWNSFELACKTWEVCWFNWPWKWSNKISFWHTGFFFLLCFTERS